MGIARETEPPKAAGHPAPPGRGRRDRWLWLLIGVAIGLAYGQTWRHDFLNFDDDQYVTDHPQVAHGLTRAGAWWALTGIHAANWHPLTTLSHMLDVELFGMHAGAHLAVNVALHIASAILLYEILRSTTGRRGASACAAALFALHPLRVESVAWVSERKDVLSVALGLATLARYVAFVRRPNALRYGLVVLLFALALLAKPMLVTLPLLLLLFDYWPLARLPSPAAGSTRRAAARRRFAGLVAEKLPLFVLAAASAVVTIVVQHHAGAMAAATEVPLRLRIETAVVAYAAYLHATVWPVGLAVVYPQPAAIPAWQLSGAATLLLAISAAVAASAARRPYLVTGWLWFLVALLPVIGLVRVGDQAMADRYTYLPSIGLSLMVAWTAADLAPRWRWGRAAAGAGAAAVLVACLAATTVQVGHWRDAETLFGHAVAVTAHNAVAHTNLAVTLLDRGRVDEAVAHFEAAARARPDSRQADANVRIARGIALARRGDRHGAAALFADLLRDHPGAAMAHFNWAVLLAEHGDLVGAMAHHRTALRLAPASAEGEWAIGRLLARQGEWLAAAAHFRRAIDLAPFRAEILGDLGVALEAGGDRRGALAAYREFVRQRPQAAVGRYNLAGLLAELGERDAAAQQLGIVLSLRPGWEPAVAALQRLSEPGGAAQRPTP